MKIAILDDYQNAALRMADWTALSGRAEITVFNDHVADSPALVERLLPFEVVCRNAGSRRHCRERFFNTFLRLEADFTRPARVTPRLNAWERLEGTQDHRDRGRRLLIFMPN